MVKFYLPILVPEVFVRIGVVIALVYRKWRYGYPFRKIKLTQGKYAIVDVDDFNELNKYKWYAIKDYTTFYARRTTYINGKTKLVQMHRQVMKYEGSLLIDHINGNGLDNRKNNLRIVTPAQNCHNTRKTAKPSSSKYRGVSRSKKQKKWQAYIGYNGRRMHLGFFDNETEAAKAYDEAAQRYYGEFAKLNFTERTEDKTNHKRIRIFQLSVKKLFLFLFLPA